jgi:hypothetical protein
MLVSRTTRYNNTTRDSYKAVAAAVRHTHSHHDVEYDLLSRPAALLRAVEADITIELSELT